MRQTAKVIVSVIVCLSMTSIVVAAERPVWPVKVSDNHRYFVDQKGSPVFWLGTTQWQLFREYTVEDARTILEKTADKGFVFAQVMLMGVGDGTKPNVYGQKPWIDDNPLTPNEAYFKNVDAVLKIAGGEQRQHLDDPLPSALPQAHHGGQRPGLGEMAGAAVQGRAEYRLVHDAGGQAGVCARPARAGGRPARRRRRRHLITFKPDPAPYSSSFIHDEKWLDFDSMQTWKSVELIYPMVTQDYNLKPVKPVLMAEGRIRAGLGIRVRRHAPVDSPAGVLLLPGRAPITPTATTTVGGCCPPGSRPSTPPARCNWAS